MSTTAGRPVWVDLATSDAAAARDFYARLFGWQVEVNPDPQYGGYAIARLDGRDVAGIGPAQSPEQPTAWSVYIGSDDLEETARRITAAGGTVVAPPFDVGDQGRMAAFQDPSGAFICAWQGTRMSGFGAEGVGTFAWAELNARGFDGASRFYQEVFGWSTESTDLPDGQVYVQFSVGGQPMVGGMEMNPMVPPQVPSYWMPYFRVDDADTAFERALEAGGREVVAPSPFPGGRFAIVSDPQGAMFGLHQLD